MKPVRRILRKRKSAACIRSLLLILAFLLVLSAPSCRRDPSVDAALLDKAEQAANKPALPPEAEEYTGDWAPEIVYSPGDLSDVEGIRYIHGRTVKGPPGARHGSIRSSIWRPAKTARSAPTPCANTFRKSAPMSI